MRCINCGNDSDGLLCKECRTMSVLDSVYNQILGFRLDECQNEFLCELYKSQEGIPMWDNIIPLLELFDRTSVLFYYINFYRLSNKYKNLLLHACIEYLDIYKERNDSREEVIYRLVNDCYKPPKEFVAQKAYCDYIACTEGLFPELYITAAFYFDCIGDYDIADKLLNYVENALDTKTINKYIFGDYASKKKAINDQREKIEKHRAKPYWPTKEEDREKLKPFYDERGIDYTVRGKKSIKVKESDFILPDEHIGGPLDTYVAFWCYECSAMVGKGTCQIGAVKVNEGKIVDEFQEYVRPWDHIEKQCQAAAKKLNIAEEVFKSAETVDIVFTKFMQFVESYVLISTGAMGEQLSLISRAARYAGLKTIDNKLFDILDYAAEVNPEYDLMNNNREYIIKDLGIEEGFNALAKARVNMRLYEKLKELDR